MAASPSVPTVYAGSVNTSPVQIKEKRPDISWAIGVYLFAAAIDCGRMWAAIDPGASSTAALAYPFALIHAALAAVPFAVMGFSIGMLLRARSSGKPTHLMVGACAAIVSAGYLLHLYIEAAIDERISGKVARIQGLDEAGLQAFLDDDTDRHNRYVLGAIASNPRTSGTTLAQIVELDEPSLHESYVGARRELKAGNPEGRSVMWLIARHPNLPAGLLPALARSPNVYVVEVVAANPLTPPAVLKDISDGRHGLLGYRIMGALSQNRSTPESVIRSLASDPRADDHTLMNIYRRASTPDEVLAHVKERIDNCELLDPDAPFTPCVPHSTDWDKVRRKEAGAPRIAASGVPGSATREQPGSMEWSGTRPADSRIQICALEGTSRSVDGGSPSQITFSNRSDETIEVYWLDAGGRRKLYQTLEPGQGYTQQTGVGHPWLVASAAGDCLGVYFPALEARHIEFF